MSIEINNPIKLITIMIFSMSLLIGCSEESDPVAEGPIIEEPVIEEPVIEEPVIETPISLSISTNLSSNLTVPQVNASGTGTASLTVDLETNEISGTLTVNSLTDEATAAHIHNGLAGTTGGIVITLNKDATNVNLFAIPTGTILSTEQLSALQNAELYFNVHTAANASGEIRGQILNNDHVVIRAALNGDNQIPTTVTSINTGLAFITVNTTTGLIRGNVKNSGLDDANALHIHDAFAGKNGAVVTGLDKDSVDPSLWTIKDNTTLDEGQLTRLLAGGMYFNVHTPAHASGELRGQILSPNTLVLRTELNGSFQVPTPIISAGSAIGFVTVNTETGTITANVIVDSLPDVTAAHIHSGFAGENGGVVIALSQDANDSSLLSSTSATFNSMALSDFTAGKLYFNVHTATNPAGDVRGQIMRDNIVVTRNELDSSQTVPSITSSATGIGYTTLNTSDNSFYANIRTTGLTSTAAHIHQGAVGSAGGIALALSNDASNSDFWSGNITLNATQLELLSTDELYFNVHSNEFAAGEIRGQITQ